MFTRKKGMSLWIIVSLFSLLLVFVSGCSKSTNTSEPGAAKKGEFVIKMAIPSAPEDSCTMAFFKFKELVEAKSNGRVSSKSFQTAN